MHNLNKWLVGIVIYTVAFISSAYSADKPNFNTQQLNFQLIEELIHNGDGCIFSMENNGKLYINAERIFPTNQGIFLKDEKEDLIQLPSLFSDELGCYIPIKHSSKTDDVVYVLITCKNCQKVFTPTIFNGGKCPKCGTQN